MDPIRTLISALLVLLMTGTSPSGPGYDVPTAPPPTMGVTVAPTATPQGMPSRDLWKGLSGEDVRLLQRRLIELGYLVDVADGDFGKKTEDAVKLFQYYHGLTQDGIAGRDTLSRLFSDDVIIAPPRVSPTPSPTPTLPPPPVPTATATQRPTASPTPTAAPATPSPTPTAAPATPSPTPTVAPATPSPTPTAAPATPEPATPEPPTPEPATPEPATPEPVTPEPEPPLVTEETGTSVLYNGEIALTSVFRNEAGDLMLPLPELAESLGLTLELHETEPAFELTYPQTDEEQPAPTVTVTYLLAEDGTLSEVFFMRNGDGNALPYDTTVLVPPVEQEDKLYVSVDFLNWVMGYSLTEIDGSYTLTDGFTPPDDVGPQ